MNFENYAYAGRRQQTKTVILSLMATMIGASATIGLSGRTASIGFPSFWWLTCGAIGLFLQSILLSEKIKNIGAGTLPSLAEITISKTAGILIALIIVVSWVGIVAAQFVASGSLISSIATALFAHTGKNSQNYYKITLFAVWIIITAYTVWGGQLSVVKTDIIQALFIFLGVFAAFVYVFFFVPATENFNNSLVFKELNFFNNKFGVFDFINLLFITGGTYFLGPDILSRNTISKDSGTAKRAAEKSALLLFAFSVIITLLSLWGKVYFETTSLLSVEKNGNPLLMLINGRLPLFINILLIIGLICSLLSSADTSLINAAVIAEVNLLKGKNVKRTKIIVMIISTLALLLALFKQDIISLFMLAYSIYSPGIVFPLSFAVIFYKKREINKRIWFIGVILGSLSGILNALPIQAFKQPYLPLVGMFISLIMSALSVCVFHKSSSKKTV